MGYIICNLLVQLFGDPLSTKIKDYIDNAFGMLSIQFSDESSIVATSMNIFAAIACSLLILYFTMNIVDQASRDMFTLEKLIVSFIKFLAAFVVLLCLTPIMNSLVKAGQGFYGMVDEFSFVSEESGSELYYQPDTGSGSYVFLDESSDDYIMKHSDEVRDEYDSWKAVRLFLSSLVIGILPMIIMWIASGVAFFLIISNSLQIIIRGCFAPLAVVQLFDEGMRSSGIKYIKKFAGLCLMFAVLAVIVKAGSILSQSFAINELTDESGTITHISKSNINQVITFSNVLTVCVIRVAVVGAMVGAGKIADEVLGV